jgi:hypothetical protein
MKNELTMAEKLFLKLPVPLIFSFLGAVAAKVVPIEFAAFCSGVI